MTSQALGCYWTNEGNCAGRCFGFGVDKECVEVGDDCVCPCGLWDASGTNCSGWCSGADQTCQFYNGTCMCGVEEEEKKSNVQFSRQIDPTIQLLVNRQKDRLPSVLRELRGDMEGGRRKEGHWIWWVFPQNRPGKSEPRSCQGIRDPSCNSVLYGVGKTNVTRDTAAQLLAYAPADWKTALEQISSLIERYGYQTMIPSADWGRISYFCDFWSQIPELPDWLRSVIVRILFSRGYVDVDGLRDATINRLWS